MDKIYNKFFIYNEEIKKSSEFNDEFFNNGKSLYEVIRVIERVPIFLEKHLNRLENTAKLTGTTLPLNLEEIKAKLNLLIKLNEVRLGNIKIVFNFFNGKCDFYGYFLKHHYPTEESYYEGVKTILYFGERNNPNAKVMNVSFRKQVDEKISNENAYEAILVDNLGNITEGSKSNIFMVKGNNLITAPLKAVLPGITREMVISVSEALGYTVIEQYINYKSLGEMDGLFITGTSPKVLPINMVDSIKYDSSNNKVIKQVLEGYNKEIEEYISKY